MIKRLLMLLVFIPGLAFAGENAISFLVPMTATIPITITVDTPETFMGEDNVTWDMIIDGIKRTEKGQTLVMKVQGFGGQVTEGNRLVNAMVDAEKKGVTIVADIVGPAYSMHAYMALFASKIILEPNGSLMFHAMATSDSFLGLISFHNTTLDPATETLVNYYNNQALSRGVLTKSEISAILNGKDVYKTTIDHRIITVIVEDDEGTWSIVEQSLMLFIKIVIVIFILGLGKRLYNKVRG